MRLSYVADPPPTNSPEEEAIVARVRARRGERGLIKLDRALLHAPQVADGWNAFIGAIRTKTSLADDVREIAICRVAVLNHAWYEWQQHSPLAEASGVSKQGLQTLRGTGEGGLTEKQLAVKEYTDAMTTTVKVPDAVFDKLRPFFNEQEIVELTATVAGYNTVSRFLVALDVGEMNDKGDSV